MITVKNLVKKFGNTIAVNNISFAIPQGQVVGFLGPNGAGKSTTMRILTGYLPPDEGEAQLANHDLISDSHLIRKKIGYIPENNPLPEDIEVTEFLHFIARLRGLTNSPERLKRVQYVVKTCSLTTVVGKKIGQLSKGFRQRVALAQSIIHDPEILILDEPTSGLDPNQVQDVRKLISNLRTHKTVLISTHILTEVQQTCDRILIINKGEIVGDGTPQNLIGLKSSGTKYAVAMKGPQEKIRESLSSIQGVRAVYPQANIDGIADGCAVECEPGQDIREEIFRLAMRENWPLLALRLESESLEDVFRSLTQNGGTSGL